MNPTFRVVYSGAVRAALHKLLIRAAKKDPGLARRALAAVKTIDERLQSEPRQLGEARFHLQHLHLEVRGAIVLPLAVSFAIHDTQPLVFVTGYRLLSGRE